MQAILDDDRGRIDHDAYLAFLAGIRHALPEHVYGHLTYSGVKRYTVDANADGGHGDLLTHEIRLGADGLPVHELLFAGGSRLLVEFERFAHAEEPVNPPGTSPANRSGSVAPVPSAG